MQTSIEGSHKSTACDRKTLLLVSIFQWTELLKDNSDVRVSELERLYYNCEYHTALKLSNDILKCDPYHPACLPLHVALLVELSKTSDLFKLSHNLVDLFPEWSVAWYAVGMLKYIKPLHCCSFSCVVYEPIR